MQSIVLLIDDEADSRTGMAEVLRSKGYTVVEVANGREALDRLIDGASSFQPSVIVLDLAMPVMSGWEFLAIVKSYHRLSKIPIVVVSGKDSPDVAMRYGVVDAFIAKPYEPEAFAAAVAKAMKGGREVTPPVPTAAP